MIEVSVDKVGEESSLSDSRGDMRMPVTIDLESNFAKKYLVNVDFSRESRQCVCACQC